MNETALKPYFWPFVGMLVWCAAGAFSGLAVLLGVLYALSHPLG